MEFLGILHGIPLNLEVAKSIITDFHAILCNSENAILDDISDRWHYSDYSIIYMKIVCCQIKGQ